MTKARDVADLLANGTVDTDELADAIITTAKLVDGSVTTAKIPDGAITAPKLNVQGSDIPYDNTTSGISANTLQEAIDYLNVLSGGGSAGAQATYTRENFTATAGQTIFTTTNGYELGYLQVYMNGVLLATSDFTANDGSTVVLAVGASAGDEISTIALDSFAISEVLRILNISASAPDDSVSILASGALTAQNLGKTTPSSIDDASLTSGLYKVSTGSTGNPLFGSSGSLLILPSNVNGGGQGQQFILANATTTARSFIRHQANSYNDAAFQPWREVVTTTNEIAQLELTPKFCVFADTGQTDGWLMSGTSGTFAACDTIVTNIGNGYSIASNRFTAPVAGTYHFSVNMSLHGTDGTLADNSVGYGFLKNGSKLRWASYDGGLNNTWSAANFTESNAIEISGPHLTAIITLEQGDYIQFGWQNMSKALGVRNMVFSGFLIG